jgi:hypothetical protein
LAADHVNFSGVFNTDKAFKNFSICFGNSVSKIQVNVNLDRIRPSKRLFVKMANPKKKENSINCLFQKEEWNTEKSQPLYS